MSIISFITTAICLFISVNAFTANATNLQQLDEKGFTIVANLFDQTQIEQLRKCYNKIKIQALQIIENDPPSFRLFSETNQNHQSLYWHKENKLILQAGFGRYDLYKGFSSDLASLNLSFQLQTLNNLMTDLMGGDFTSYSGIILSTASSKDQYWHRDTESLDREGSSGSKLVQLDDFYFTVLIPITVPFTLENGTTEFVEGSHRLSLENSSSRKTTQLEVPLGSALVFNGKSIHRGKANESLEDRPAIYIVYHKKWYNDQYRRGIPETQSDNAITSNQN